VVNNDAWLCAEIANLQNDDNGCEKPESDIDQTCGAGQGELKDNLFFTIWRDTDCDNILNEGIQEIPGYCGGPGDCSNVKWEYNCNYYNPPCYWVSKVPGIPAEQILVQGQPAKGGYWPIADSTNGTPLVGDQTYCLGIKWNVPLSVGNEIQTDSLLGDVKFIAVQSRNMDTFKCSDLYEEICDGIDNNYNGQVDENCLCSSDAQCNDGIYCNGIEICNAQNACISSGNPCPGQNVGPNCDDSCNETNNNCTANDLDGTTCSGGLCQTGACIASCIPTTEVCGNGIDDDCDGLIDEDCSIVQDNFNTYTNGNILGQGSWEEFSTHFSNFFVQESDTFEGSKAIFNNSQGDSVIIKAGNLLSDGQQTFYIKTIDRNLWSSDSEAQIRITKGVWALGDVFCAITFEQDGDVAYSIGNDVRTNFATYNDNEWIKLDVEWRSTDQKARYRLNNGVWTSWDAFWGSNNFTNFDHVGFDFDLNSGSGGVYFDNLY